MSQHETLDPHMDATPDVAVESPSETKPNRPRQAVIATVVGAMLLLAGSKGYASFMFGKTHVDTDNAYVTGDLVGISPTVSGTVAELTVQEGDFVKKGQLIARLTTDGPQAEVEQAEANLRAAESQVPQAEAALQYEQMATQAAIERSRAAIQVQESRTKGSMMQVRLSADTQRNQVQQAESSLAQARAQSAQARAGIETARANLESAHQAVRTAERNANAANAAVQAAQADAERAAQDLARYRKLIATDAITRQQFETAQATATSAAANLSQAKERSEASLSQVAEAKAGVAVAQAQIVAAQRQADAAEKQVQVAQAGVGLARANFTQVGIQSANVSVNENQGTQVVADLSSAQAGTQQVEVRKQQIAIARAQVEQARAALAQAKVRIKDSNLYAPCDGYVVKKSINVGTAINPGQTVVTITRGNATWVMANYKETQLANVREGQTAELEVDAFPGKKFRGRVLSVIRATGSATTLLPPDNSTGNFTKVVQRVPVKISIEPEEGSTTTTDVAEVRQGMSVVATIDTASEGAAAKGQG